MNIESPRSPNRPSVLATDLDGTLIPLPERHENRGDLATLRDHFASTEAVLVFVTGRHLEAIRGLLIEHELPRPDWIIGDVGTTLYRFDADWAEVDDYASCLAEIVAELPIDALRAGLAEFSDLRPQEDHKQGRHKLSYYVDADRLDEIVDRTRTWLAERRAPYSLIGSVDPFNGDGLLDLLPRSVSKAFALDWWRQYVGHDPREIVFAGDSGNDLAAFEAGYRTIVVGNADRKLAERVRDHHDEQGWDGRLHLPAGHATSGVVEGCRWFELLPREEHLLGATSLPGHRTEFRVWAPDRDRVDVRTERSGEVRYDALTRDRNGVFSAVVDGVGPGTRYGFRLDKETERPDPYSRFQPDGVHGPSEVIAPNAYSWRDDDWQGIAKRDLVVYELHVGTLTEAGTYAAAVDHLDRLRDLGITAVELMPVAQTPGKWNWGYDGVNLFAPNHCYGRPDDLRAFVDAAHARGIAVLLDVVYNHVGPEGNYLAEFGPYRSERHHTPWGDAFNYDGTDAGPVRRFVIDNAIRWLDEYHLDGLRLDAVHFLFDDSTPHVLDDLRVAVSDFEQRVARPIHLIAETNVHDAELLATRSDRDPYDALWCDDFAHAVYSVVAPATRLTEREYHGIVDVGRALDAGFVYEGESQQRVPVGEDVRTDLGSLLVGLQTHDLVGNELHGRRLHHLSSPETHRAAAALHLLAPWIPLLFMGEESASPARFRFFTDFEDPRLREAVEAGRRSLFGEITDELLVSPLDPRAFAESQLVFGDDEMTAWYRQLLEVRREWRDAGLLSSENLRVTTDSENSLVVLRYETNGHAPAFVAARLTAATAGEVYVVVDGDIRLDSANPEVRELARSGRVTLTGCRAIIGTGTMRTT